MLSAGGNIPDRYIVVFKSSVGSIDRATDDVVRASGAQLHYRYRAALHGFAATIPAAALEGIRRNPNVEYVEAD
ncbi:MAG TPA: protease inhibitor I9 family protein, partial [Gemmatimonadales bacterium]|nr:protease inhibitor I9 family protein [Gemmatimonadales bacterium]